MTIQLFQARIHALQKTLENDTVDLLLIDSPIDLFYLTGMTFSTGLLAIPKHSTPKLFVDGRYVTVAKQKSPVPVDLSKTETVQNFLYEEKPTVVAFDSHSTTYQSYKSLNQTLEIVAKRLGSSIECRPLESPVKHLRSIKGEEELEILRKAAQLCSEGFDFACTQLKEGVREREVALELEMYWKRRGGETLSFESIIAFGSNSAMPHYRAGQAILKKGDIVLIDIGIRFQHYHSDMTRVLFFGQPNPQLEKIYFMVKEAQEIALSLCRPGVFIGEIDKATRNFFAKHNLEKYFTHGLGHGVGLEIHEYPTIRQDNKTFCNTPLKKGMVITIEPGIYLEGLGGVRIENCIIIQEDGYEDLTRRSTELKIV